MVRIEWDEYQNSNAEIVHAVEEIDKETLTDKPQYLEVRPGADEQVPSPDRWDEYDMERVEEPVSEEADAVYVENTPIRALRVRYYEGEGTNEADLYTVQLVHYNTPERSAGRLVDRYREDLSARRVAVAALAALILAAALYLTRNRR